MIIQDRAIILKAIDYQESSKILTVLSQKHGKIAIIAKGAKRPKNKFAGILETGNVLDVVYYYKASRNIQTLSEANIHFTSLKFRQQMERAAILYATLELVAQLVHENEVNENLFKLAHNFIIWLGEEEEVSPSVFVYIQLRLADISGLGITDEQTNKQTSFLNIASGNISEHAESELSYKLTANQAAFLKKVLNNRNKSLFKLKLENEELKQLVHHLDVYFKYHIDGYQERRSDAIFEQMLL